MKVFTVGTSNNPWPKFQHLLDVNGIGCVVDVRSSPRSRLPHFNRVSMRVCLNRVGISYLYLGHQLGGMPAGLSGLYSDMAQTGAFLSGIETLLKIAPRTRLAMTCAEHDPITCHRFLLISRHLSKLGVDVEHIGRDGSLESQRDAEMRMMRKMKASPDLFSSEEQRLHEGYRRQELRIRGEAE